MKFPIRFSRYNLDSQGSPNAQCSSGATSGVIVEHNGGYGCMQAWPELGDHPLEYHMNALRAGQPTLMGQACLNCCRIDGDARRSGINLFSGLVAPTSHSLLMDVNSHDEIDSLIAKSKTDALVKIKGTSNLTATLQAVEQVSRICRVRIDFNSCLDESSFESFVSSLSKQAHGRIEFVEDPVPYDEAQWRRISERTNVMLALDWGPNEAVEGFGVRIWKPARQLEVPPGRTHCITHNMDHAIGRAYAVYQASRFNGNLLECGLDDVLPIGGETGLGLDCALKDMTWEDLT